MGPRWPHKEVSMIITIGGIKGGNGKSTIATNFAVMRSCAGKDLLLVDADEQKSATIFATIRRQEHPERPQCTCTILVNEGVRDNVPTLHAKFDDVIIDVGGRDTVSQRAAIMVSDLVLVPFNPRAVDIWTIEDIEKMVARMRLLNERVRVLSFINRADPVGPDNADSREILTELDWMEFVDCPIVNRKAFGKAMAHGLSVPELRPSDRKAADEIQALYRRVFDV